MKVKALPGQMIFGQAIDRENFARWLCQRFLALANQIIFHDLSWCDCSMVWRKIAFMRV